MIPLADKENKSSEKQKVCYICKKEFINDNDDKKYLKIRDLVIFIIWNLKGTAHDVCNLL